MIGRRIGRYRIIAPLGQGGIATVWKAHDELLNRTVAIKILDPKLALSPQARRRFLHDAQAAGHLSHPGVIAVHDSGEAEGTVYIVLALVEGETVSERAGRRLMPFDEAIRIGIAAAEALAHAHEHRVIHRDVTGRNLMVGRDGRVIMLDFGLALAAWESRVTTTDTAMGTAPYMAPELFAGEGATERSDVYGLGVVMYEMLTGAMPFGGEHPQAVVYAAMNLSATPLRERRPDVPAGLEHIVLRAMARDPAARFESAAAIAAALRGLETGDVVDGTGPVASSRTSENGHLLDDRGALPSPLYLAVMPFESESPADPDDTCRTLAGRLGETVSCALAKTSAVRVVAPLEGPLPSDPREVARRLGANALLRGTVRRSGTQMRVSYAVLDPFRGVQIAGDVLDGSAMRVFDVEDQVVASVTRALGGAIGVGASPGTVRPPDPAARERYLQALGYLRRYDNEASVDGAIQILERLIAADDRVAAWHAAVARAYLAKNEHTKERAWEIRAASACERARALDAESPDVRLALGMLRSASGSYDAAAEEFESVLRVRATDLDASLGLARAHRGAGRFAEAERIARQAIAHHPGDWRGHLVLGQIHYKAGDFVRAVEPWRRVNELTPDNALGRRLLGAALYLCDRLDEAVDAFEESVRIQPNDEAFANLGTTFYYLDRLDESVAALRKAVELAPSDPKRWGDLGNACHWIPGREAEARQALETAVGLMREQLERNPVQEEWWGRLAGWLANLGRNEEAEAAIRRALELAPESVHCMVRAGRLYLRLGDRDACLQWLERARRAGYGTAELRRSRELAPLRDDPRFLELIGEGPPDSDHGETRTAG